MRKTLSIMRTLAHADAPADDIADRIWSMVMDRAAPADVTRAQLKDFDAASRIMTVPGYVQPNGFLTFKLGGQNGDRVLRLHFWPQGMPDQPESAGIHDHVFDFTSLVLMGTAPMINTVYDLRHDDTGGMNLYEVDYANPRESKINCVEKNLRGHAVLEETVAQGTYYSLRAGLFHTSRIHEDREAITLLASRLSADIQRPRFLTRHFGQDYTRPALTHEHRTTVALRLSALKNTLSL